MSEWTNQIFPLITELKSLSWWQVQKRASLQHEIFKRLLVHCDWLESVVLNASRIQVQKQRPGDLPDRFNADRRF